MISGWISIGPSKSLGQLMYHLVLIQLFRELRPQHKILTFVLLPPWLFCHGVHKMRTSQCLILGTSPLIAPLMLMFSWQSFLLQRTHARMLRRPSIANSFVQSSALFGTILTSPSGTHARAWSYVLWTLEHFEKFGLIFTVELTTLFEHPNFSTRFTTQTEVYKAFLTTRIEQQFRLKN